MNTKTPQSNKNLKKKAFKSAKKQTRYFDFYDDLKIDGRDTEW